MRMVSKVVSDSVIRAPAARAVLAVLAIGASATLPAAGQELQRPVVVQIDNPFTDALTTSVVKELEDSIRRAARFTLDDAKPGQPVLRFIVTKAATVQKNGAGVNVLTLEERTEWSDGGKPAKGWRICMADKLSTCTDLTALDTALADRPK